MYLLGGCGWAVCLLACHAGDRGSFLHGEESSATSGLINVGHEWCAEAGALREARLVDSDQSSQTRDGLLRKRHKRAAHNVHKCECLCVPEIK